jgi:hypothetical protein
MKNSFNKIQYKNEYYIVGRTNKNEPFSTRSKKISTNSKYQK